MLQSRLHRRTLLGAGAALVGGPVCARPGDSGAIGWYAGPPGARSDPFVSWACETMQLQACLRVRRVGRPELADVVCVPRPSAGLTGLRPIAWRNGLVGVTRRGAGRAGADQFAAFLASAAATAHARRLMEGA